MNAPASRRQAVAALLEWYVQSGLDETTGTVPARFSSRAAQPAPARIPQNPDPALPAKPSSARPRTRPFDAQRKIMPVDEAVGTARHIAAGCHSHTELEQAVMNFDGCTLKAGARRTVFADGVPGAGLLVIGEAPGREEDRLGKPFTGRAGKLLDRMLGAAGYAREKNVLLSNTVYWRPPGNRTPTPSETAICRPFVHRLIEITAPDAVLLAGGTPLTALLGITGIVHTRGNWQMLETDSGMRIPALPVFHPAFLLRHPAHKRLAWHDLLALGERQDNAPKEQDGINRNTGHAGPAKRQNTGTGQE